MSTCSPQCNITVRCLKFEVYLPKYIHEINYEVLFLIDIEEKYYIKVKNFGSGRLCYIPSNYDTSYKSLCSRDLVS